MRMEQAGKQKHLGGCGRVACGAVRLESATSGVVRGGRHLVVAEPERQVGEAPRLRLGRVGREYLRARLGRRTLVRCARIQQAATGAPEATGKTAAGGSHLLVELLRGSLQVRHQALDHELTHVRPCRRRGPGRVVHRQQGDLQAVGAAHRLEHRRRVTTPVAPVQHHIAPEHARI